MKFKGTYLNSLVSTKYPSPITSQAQSKTVLSPFNQHVSPLNAIIIRTGNLIKENRSYSNMGAFGGD